METEGKMEWDSMELSPSQAQQAHEPHTSHYNSTPALSSLGPMAQDLEIKCFFCDHISHTKELGTTLPNSSGSVYLPGAVSFPPVSLAGL